MTTLQKDEFYLDPTDPIFSAKTYEDKITLVTSLIPLSLKTLEKYEINAVRKGDLEFFLYLLGHEKELSPDFKHIGSITYQLFMDEACIHSRLNIVLHFVNFKKTWKDNYYPGNPWSCPDRRRPIEHHYTMRAIGEGGSIDCFEVLRQNTSISDYEKKCALDSALKHGHQKLVEHIQAI